MTASTSLIKAQAALDRCGSAIVEIDGTCCVPNRRPCLQDLGEMVRQAAATLDSDKPDSTGMVLAALEDAGAQVGRLQVGCCTSDRIPLFAEVLEGLTSAQLAVKALGQAH